MTAFIPKTWIKKDLHVHENHSSDAPGATVERYCRMAEVRGIDEIAFTTHLIIAGPDIEHGISYNQVPDYLNEIWTAQETTSVKLRTGLEVDYFPSKERHLETIIENLPLDIVLGSLHYIRGIDIGSRRQSPKFFLGKNLEDALTIFFDDWRKAIESGLFDIMAHPDYFRKYLSLSRDSPEPIPPI